MNLFQRLLNLFSPGPGTPGRRHLTIYVWSNRCKAAIAGQVDLLNELSLTDDDDAVYFARKLLSSGGKNRCFDNVEVQLWFDGNKKLVRHEESGGKWLEQTEYERLSQAE